MFAAGRERNEMYYVEVTWLGIIVFFTIVFIERRKAKKRKNCDIPEEMKKDVAEEVDKFHKWWDDNMAEWKAKGWID